MYRTSATSNNSSNIIAWEASVKEIETHWKYTWILKLKEKTSLGKKKKKKEKEKNVSRSYKAQLI